MNPLAVLLRSLAKARFRLLGHATIKDIPTDRFNHLIVWLRDDGWTIRGHYQGVDAWIDYGRLTLVRGRVRLLLEWDNWTEGSVEGPRRVVEAIAAEQGFEVCDQWRWSEYDEV